MSESRMNEINKYRVKELPCSAYYIPNYITVEQETNLLNKVYSAPKPKWKDLLDRRLQNWGGIPHPKAMIQEDLPEWLLNYVKKVSEFGVFEDKIPNHVLVNEYLPGQGIMPHTDGPLFYPTIATISIGSHVVLNYYKKTFDEDFDEMETLNRNSSYVGSLLLERCSLLIVQDDLYDKHLHGIEKVEKDEINDSIKNLDVCKAGIGSILNRERRVSITIRYVSNAIKSSRFFKLK